MQCETRSAATLLVVSTGSEARRVSQSGINAILGGDALDPVILDHHIGEQLAGHLVKRGIGDGVVDLKLEQATGADIMDPAKAKAFDGVMDGTALRVEHAILEADVNADFHRLCLS